MLKNNQRFRFKSELKFTELFGIGPCDGVGGNFRGWHLDEQVKNLHLDLRGHSCIVYPDEEFVVNSIRTSTRGRETEAEAVTHGDKRKLRIYFLQHLVEDNIESSSEG